MLGALFWHGGGVVSAASRVSTPLGDMKALSGREKASALSLVVDVASTAEPESWNEPLEFGCRKKAPFPVSEAMHGFAREYCLAVAELSQTPPEMAFFAMVGIAATCIQKQVIVQSGPGRYLPTNLWAAGVAASGCGKTVVLTEVQRPFDEFERELRESIEAKNAENARDRQQVEAQI